VNKLIIEARINEYASRGANPHVPWTPEEIAADAASCRAAGASVLHFHARGQDGTPDHNPAVYADIIARLHSGSDILVHPTLGAATLDAAPERRIEHVIALSKDPATRADFAPMDMGSSNLDYYDPKAGRFFTTDVIYKNSTGTLQHFAKAFSQAGLKHYVVSWNLGFTRQALAFMDMKLLPEPMFLVFILTDGNLLSGHPGTPEGLDAHLQMLPSDRRIEWGVCNHGGNLLPLVDKIITGGGHISIGLGDYPYTELGQPTNADLIGHVADRARALGREVATPDEVRTLLEMP
jgi:3-keto-5-aminohexanoate cleavage enzyme